MDIRRSRRIAGLSPELKATVESYEPTPFILESRKGYKRTEQKGGCVFPTVVLGILTVVWAGVVYTALKTGYSLSRF